ncbi:TPR-like protein [Choiromyces venosus 120613-1]|uniref:TPR-like protein n=1 Tax=Choiromyces venosus 120613-1 TaxID=1336337 RepID=A0A3N4K5B0_9PEZI|nr:TPR-like protein [Choiromyces venosus 120613-1]
MTQDPRALLAMADKHASSARGGFSFFGAKQDKLEKAADLYTQAASVFRVQKLGREAGQTLEKAAAIQTEINEPDEAANSHIEAYKAYRKDDPSNAARVLAKAIQHYTLRGNFRRAATHQQNLAELLELEVGDIPKALEAYELAGDWFQSDNAEALANKVFLKVADLAALEGIYPKAVERYEGVARSSAGNNLMKWSLKDYFLKAGICHLANRDKIALKKALDSYVDLDPSFPSTREFQLLNDMLEADENNDAEAFADKIFQYDQMSKLDKWKTTMLLRVKNSIEAEEEDGLA